MYQDIDISRNTVVLKCQTVNNTTEAIVVNAGAGASRYIGQTVKSIGNAVKQYNSLDLVIVLLDIRCKVFLNPWLHTQILDI
ncbi:hypothetical protein [Enterobacter phage 02_vB_Eclo_IJM]|nr:hypothetical protein [Enterobacter phage 02_vB_Eclo_IJM]